MRASQLTMRRETVEQIKFRQDSVSIENKENTSEGFASRWSRRKLENKHEPRAEGQTAEPQEPSIPLNTIIPDATTGKMQTGVEADRRKLEADSVDNQQLTDDDMPDPELLDEKSDYSGFLSPGVSDKLRKVALRKLFYGASFNIRDGLDDYDDDFTNFEPLGDIVTSDMKHREEMKEKRRQEELAKAENEAAEKAAKESEEQEELTETEETAGEAAEETAAIDDQTMEEELAGNFPEEPTGSKT